MTFEVIQIIVLMSMSMMMTMRTMVVMIMVTLLIFLGEDAFTKIGRIIQQESSE
jgi:hypothetical protein